jgi:predicted anti-sigma-YlaC factor YlaD
MTRVLATGSNCEHEAAVVEAASRGRIPSEIEPHLATCASCREVRDIVLSMSQLAVDTERLAERRRLPEAGQLWWKAQLARRWDAERRALAPLDAMQRVEAGVGVVAAVVLLLALIRALGSAFFSLPAPDATTPLFRVLSMTSVPLVLGLLLLAATATVALRRLKH